MVRVWSREYTFGVDRIFGPDSSQEQVYQEGGLDNVVASVMQGTNACVFAYGCSGTGKTFTMQVRGWQQAPPFAPSQPYSSKYVDCRPGW